MSARTAPLDGLLAELERFGAQHDAAGGERSRRMLNVTRETGELLALLVLATRARSVLEVGTSNGYSTLWLAQAAQTLGGSVTTVESSEYKAALAAANFDRSGLAQAISIVRGDAGRLLRAERSDSRDLIFLDSERDEYVRWWPDLRRVLRAGGLMVVDNATSHHEELAPLRALVAGDAEFTHCIVPVGKGELLAVKLQRTTRSGDSSYGGE